MSAQESLQDRIAMGAQGASAISASDVVDIGETGAALRTAA